MAERAQGAWRLAAMAAVEAVCLLTASAFGQTGQPSSAAAENKLAAGHGSPSPGPGCSCGAHPPGSPTDRTVEPYAGTPADLEPYGHFAKPYCENCTHPNIYTGAGRDIPVPANVKEVRIGFTGPVAKQADQA